MYKLAICSKYKLQRLAPCVTILIASINHQLASSPLSSLQLDSDAGQQRPKINPSNQPPRLKTSSSTHFHSAFQRMGKGFRRRGCSRLCDGRAIARCWICPDSAYISIIGAGDRRSDCPTSPRGTIGNKNPVIIRETFLQGLSGCIRVTVEVGTRCDEFCIFGVEAATTVT